MIDKNMFETQIAMTRLSMMSDWQELSRFDHEKMIREIEPFKDDWKRYNPNKTGNNRWGLSVTSYDGGLSGVPDLTSLLNYEQETGITLHNHDIKEPTEVWKQSEELTRLLEPWKKWVTRCHFLRLDRGGYFPDHYDINKHYFDYEEVRFVAFVNSNEYGFKWFYDDKIFKGKSGSLWYFNANKRHSVYSTEDNTILFVVCLSFDKELFLKMVDTAIVK